MKCNESEKETRAVKEKEKGNEAFHAGDLHEAVAYYSRSLQLMPTAIAYNNRAVVGEYVTMPWMMTNFDFIL